MNITVFGAGYVGLVQATALAEVGHHVKCVDVDQAKVDKLTQGEIPIYEPGLSPMVKENVSAGRLSFTTDAVDAIQHGKVIFIAVGTPSGDDGSADLKYVIKVAETIGENLTEQKFVVNKSTVPVGTADLVKETIKGVLNKKGTQGVEVTVLSNPEFLKEGSALSDFMKPDRIIIGTDSEAAEDAMRELYAPFSRNHEKIMVMDVRSAELTKYAANCMLATKISFMNEIANLAERMGADIEKVRQGLGSDPRIGYHFIYPGAGYGGSCFPKDVRALIHASKSVDFDPKILQSVEDRNNDQKSTLFKKVEKHFGGDLKGKTFALWGLAFKPNTDDMREAPSRVVMESLWAAGAKVQAFDPEAMNECQHIYGVREDLSLVGTKEAALQGADALIIVTEWQEFRAPDYDAFKKHLKTPTVFDGRNLYEPERMQANGIQYYSVGRK
ncbi:UDP-glucose/GDP-mannose dehydrogenase family protein [Aurantivibrio plasticivorans]